MGNALSLTSIYSVYGDLLRVYCLLINLVLVNYQYLPLCHSCLQVNMTNE